MAFEFKLPEIGEGVTEGEIVKWLVKKGDTVKEDQPIVEVMTDKATVEIASPKSGKIKDLLAKDGQVVKVGKGLVLIDEAAGSAKESAPATADKGAAGKTSQPVPVDAAPTKQPQPAPIAAASAPATHQSSANVLASPATRKAAREMGVDLSRVPGSGPQGRVTREDLSRGGNSAVSAGAPVAAPQPRAVPSTSPSAAHGTEERIPLRGIRKKIAENMLRSKQSTAHFTHVDEVDMTEIVALRESLKPESERRGVKLTYIAFLLKAIARALAEYPRLNATLDEKTQEIVVKHYFNIGIAINTQEGDLVVPVIHDADRKSLLQLATEIALLAEKGRTGRLGPADFQGGTFTLTSIGQHGGLFGTPIINYPEVGIVGFHQIKDTPVARNGQVVIRKISHLSLSLDHRLVDGALGASFLVRVIEYLEKPGLLFNVLDV